jgi:photosystem II stability/assembly factor-like uncharacterized protein
MNKFVGLVCFLVVLGAAAFAFSPRPMPVFPATATSASRVLLLGVAAADKRAVAVGERGVIVLSDDDGRNWRVAKSPTEATLTAVHFVDARRGFAVGHDAVILMTEDAGETWKQVHAAPDEQKPLLAIWFENAERGIAVGAYSSFYRTSDGGKSWQATNEFAGDLHFNALAGGADGKLFLVGESGMILHSDDAGRNWKSVNTAYKGSYFGIVRFAESGWLVFGLRGNVFRTNDDGERWNLVSPASAQASLMGGTVLPNDRVLLVGREGMLLASRNRGNSFTARKTGDGKALAGVLRLPSGACVLVGEGGATLIEPCD